MDRTVNPWESSADLGIAREHSEARAIDWANVAKGAITAVAAVGILGIAALVLLASLS